MLNTSDENVIHLSVQHKCSEHADVCHPALILIKVLKTNTAVCSTSVTCACK